MGIFTRNIANIKSGIWEGYERMLLDSIIMCIAYLTSVVGSMATMGRGEGVRAGYWTASCFLFLTGQYWAVLQEVLLVKPELFALPCWIYNRCKASVDSMGCPLPRWI